MRDTKVALFIHIVWATWDRLPLLTEQVRREIYRAIEAKCEELRVLVIALGGIENHVHLLVQLPATLAVADLVKHAKGASSHLAAHKLDPDAFFKWQGSYAAFSVSIEHLSAVRDYIAHQREHHMAKSLILEWELD